MSPRLIAIVDDDPEVRGSMDSLLRSAGLAGRSFPSGKALLCCGEESCIACIITDLHMPGMNGIELQAELARRGWRQPVIVTTGFPTDAARAQALGSGAHAFLIKPIDPDVLLEAVERAIG